MRGAGLWHRGSQFTGGCPLRIGVIGAGNVGGTLGRRWAEKGHQVDTLLDETGGRARAGSVREAAEVSDIVVLATPWHATRQAVEDAGGLAGKIVIECGPSAAAVPRRA